MSEQHTVQRSRRKKLTDKQVAALPRKQHRWVKADPEQGGLYLRIPPSGPVVYAAVARDPYNKQVWTKLGIADDMDIGTARERAREVIRRVKDGLSAFEPAPVKPDSYTAVAEQWLELHVAKEGLRTAPEIERLLRKHVLPVWGKKAFVDIRRKDINDLLDAIAKECGAWTADHVLPHIRGVANWYQGRTDDDEYRSPFVKKMRRTRSTDRERDRVLTDEELRKVWKAAEKRTDHDEEATEPSGKTDHDEEVEPSGNTFGALIRILLLTAQRRGAVVRMKWSDLKDNVRPKDDEKPVNGVWEVATEVREKGNFGAAKLPKAALAIINAQPKFKTNPYVFAATRGNGPLNGFNKRKAAFDKACGVTDWTLHDLRRTARTLMSRAGVSEKHAEHVLGHKPQGVKKIYDRYNYFSEKSAALVKLAALIERIINPLPADVRELKPAAARV